MIHLGFQGLQQEFENLAMKKDEKVSDYSTRFIKIVSELRDLGDKLHEKDVASKILQSMPQEYESLTLSLEQFGTMRSMFVEEVTGSL